MIQFDFDYKAWEEAKKKIGLFGKELLRETSEAAVLSSRYYLASRQKSRVKRLANDIAITHVSDTCNVIHSNQYYEKWVHDGRGPVVAKKTKALHWVTDDGQHVFVPKPKKVAPFAGYHYYEKAEENSRRNMNKYASIAAKRVGL